MKFSLKVEGYWTRSSQPVKEEKIPFDVEDMNNKELAELLQFIKQSNRNEWQKQLVKKMDRMDWGQAGIRMFIEDDNHEQIWSDHLTLSLEAGTTLLVLK